LIITRNKYISYENKTQNFLVALRPCRMSVLPHPSVRVHNPQNHTTGVQDIS